MITDTDTEIERRLFKLAQDELQDYPGAFSAFQQDNQNRSWYATTLSASLPSEIQLRILSLYGPLEVCRIIDPPLRKFIDEWRECYATAPCAAPLPALPSSVRPIANLEAVPVEQAANPTAAKREAVAGTSQSGDDVEEQAPAKGRSISKGAVINAFEGLHFERNGWNNALSDVPNWIEPCRVTLGRKGDKTTPATWNPVLIAAALIDKKINIKKLDAVFVHLKDWADEWREVSASFRD